MAFMKYASAVVVQPNVSKTQWRGLRVASTPPRVAAADLNGNLIKRAEELFEGQFDPSKYLLTHATIIASVDTFEPTGSKTGSVLEDGFRINRKFSDYRVTAGTQKYINNNRDAWQRDVLLASFQTFIGGHNFVEHVQVEELSKGRIIDAVARDIGDSIYIDILIATDRKHTELVKAIESGKMGTLSMGCTVDGTICTQCGHWAADETEMCPHVKYAKGNTFYDEKGRQMVVAELCGHSSIGPTGGVHFVEASWVETPAFTGAVKRNIIVVPTAELSRQAAKVLASPPPEWSADEMQKAASTLGSQPPADGGNEVSRFIPAGFSESSKGQRVANGMTEDAFLAGWEDEDADAEDGGDAPAAPAPEADPIEDAAKKLEDHLLDRTLKRVKDRMNKGDMDDALSGKSTTAPNDNVVKEASRRMYAGAVEVLIRTASSEAHLVDAVAQYNQTVGIDIPVPTYRAALVVGRSDQYQTTDEFREACDRAFGRRATLTEAKVVLKVARMLSRWDRRACNNGSR